MPTFILLIPVFLACGYWMATTVCMAIFFRKAPSPLVGEGRGEGFVSLIKPICGLEKNLYENLLTACEQDYPNYEIIYSVQNESDPALKVLEAIAEKYNTKVKIVVDETAIGPNGRLANIYNAVKHAKGDIFVFSDSDMFLEPDYLKTIVAPLADKTIGVSCTLYKAWKARNIPEFLELLSFNADFIPAVVFANVTKASIACVGASQAIRRDTLEKIGGLKPLAHYLVEDFELGRRAAEAGFKIHFIPYVANTSVDLKDFKSWWRHQVYWDQNTKAADPSGFFFTFLIRGIPFALLYAASGGVGAKIVLSLTLGTRLLTTFTNSLFFLKDQESLRAIWLLPIRDCLGFFVWFASFVKRKTHWKGKDFVLKRGKLVAI